MKPPDLDPGDLSQLLEDLARVPRLPVPEQHFAGLPSGTKVGRFVIQGEIGRGGFGVVYAATDPDLGRQVALKLLRQGIAVTRGETEWIRREAEAVARLNHPAIVTLFDSGSCEHGAFMVFELLQGEPLDARIARGPIEPREALRITSAVAGALEHAHAAGVLHRDLKPANVFLCSSGTVKVLDFGVAQLFDRAARPTSGTPRYMAPEQRDGLAEDGRTDLYSLGVVLLAMLRGGNTEVPAKPPPRTAGELERLAYDLTRHDPEQRPASARVVLDRLDGIRQRRSARRRWALAALATVLALGVWGAWEWTRPREAPPGERLVVALAPTRNDTGAPELDPLSEMLRTGLSDSPRFRIIARQRLDAALDAAGTSATSADEAGWRAAARNLGATVVVFPEARKDGAGYVVSLVARDATDGTVRFESSARAPTLEALPLALDRAAFEFRKRAGERADDLARNGKALTELTTPSLAAYRDYALGVKCAGRPTEPGSGDVVIRCSGYFRKALESDPGFALPHVQLGYMVALNDRHAVEPIAHLDAALSASKRLSRRDEAFARAWRDRKGGQEDEAIRKLGVLVSNDPEDLQAVVAVGEILFHSWRYAEAAPYMARASDVPQDFPFAFDHLVESYALSGRHAELTKLLDGLKAPRPDQIRSVVRGELWLGRFDRAIALATEAQGSLPDPQGSFILLEALGTAGRLDEADALRSSMQRQDPDNPSLFLRQVVNATKRGRSAEAWRLVTSSSPALGPTGTKEVVFLKGTLSAADRNLPRLRAELAKLPAAPDGFSALVASQLALLGTPKDVEAARRFTVPGSIAAREIDALAAWKSGDAARAVSLLVALEKEAPRPNDVLPPTYLLAEVAREDDSSEALGAAARFRSRIPIGAAAGWTYARSLLVSAEAAWRLGRRDEAMEFIGKAEELFKGADPGFPAVVETVRLRKAIESGKPPRPGEHFGPR